MNHTECPNCGTVDTDRVHVDWWNDEVRETRVCEECPAQFVAKFSQYETELEKGGADG